MEENYSNNEENNGCMSTIGRWVWKGFCILSMVIMLFMVQLMAKSCGRRAAMRTEITDVDGQLRSITQRTQRELPQQVSDCMTWVNMEMTPEYYTFVYKVDEVVDFESEFDALEQEVRQNVMANKARLAPIARLCDKSNRKICYKYYSLRDGSIRTILFDADKLI